MKTKKFLIILGVSIAISFILLYFGASFDAMSFNPIQWNVGRIEIYTTSLMVGIIASIIIAVTKLEQ